MQFKFPVVDIMVLDKDIESRDNEKGSLVFDSVSNSLGHGDRAFLISPNNQFIPFTARLIFDCTNNIVEYEACTMGIEATIDLKVKVLEVYEDSTLVIHRVKE